MPAESESVQLVCEPLDSLNVPVVAEQAADVEVQRVTVLDHAFASDEGIENEVSVSAAGPWQFGVRTLIVWMTLACALFALMAKLGVVGSVVVGWFVVLAIGHVSVNVWGSTVGRPSGSATASKRRPKVAMDIARARLPSTQLSESVPLGAMMVVCSCTGAVIGSIAGALVLLATYWTEASISAIALGSLAAAVLGGWLGFLMSRFLHVSFRALSDAADHKSSTEQGLGG